MPAEGEPADSPRRLTIRVGADIFNDVEDYVVLVRTRDGDQNIIRSKTSSYAWAHGAMESMIAVIHAHNADQASGGEESGE